MPIQRLALLRVGLSGLLVLSLNACGHKRKSGAPSADANAASLQLAANSEAKTLVGHKCATCHNAATKGGGLDFSSTEQVRALAPLMAAAIKGGRMPPWSPDSSCNSYAQDRALTDSEKTQLLTWLEAKAPDTVPGASVPIEPDAAPGAPWDTTLKPDAAYTPQTSPNDYHCFVMRWPYKEARFITSAGFTPGQPHMVHHMLAYAVEKGSETAVEALLAQSAATGTGHGYPCLNGISASGKSIVKAGMFATWTPGGNRQDQPPGEGFRVEPDQMIVMQVHYDTSVLAPVPDQSELHLATVPLVQRQSYAVLYGDPKWEKKGGMVIPAGASDVRFATDVGLDHWLPRAVPDGKIKAGEPYEISRVGLHMHLHGTAAELNVLRADGKSECLIRIPAWNFNWQESYNLKNPVVINPGDKLRLNCRFNNSGQANPLLSGQTLPAARTIEWGEGTSDEMCLGMLLIAPVASAP